MAKLQREIRKPAVSRTRRKVVTEFLDEPEERIESPVEVEPYLDEDEDSIRSIVGQFGGQDIQVKVYRVTAHGKSYCYTDGPEISEESIRSNPYGGHGRFTCHVMVSGELRRSFSANIEPPQQPVGVAGSGSADPAVLRILERMEARLTQPAQSEPMSQVLNAAVGLINSQSQKPVETPLDQVMKMAEFIVSMRGGGDGDDWKGILGGIAREVAPAVLPLLMQQKAPNGGDRQVLQQQIMLQGLSYLKKKCMMGADAGLYLDFILDNADDEKFANLIRLAATSEFEVFTRLDAEIAEPPYFAFFKFIYDGLRQAARAANPVAADPGRAGGNASDVAPNGTAGKGGRKTG